MTLVTSSITKKQLVARTFQRKPLLTRFNRTTRRPRNKIGPKIKAREGKISTDGKNVNCADLIVAAKTAIVKIKILNALPVERKDTFGLQDIVPNIYQKPERLLRSFQFPKTKKTFQYVPTP